jgi:hypothetical protein
MIGLVFIRILKNMKHKDAADRIYEYGIRPIDTNFYPELQYNVQYRKLKIRIVTQKFSYAKIYLGIMHQIWTHYLKIVSRLIDWFIYVRGLYILGYLYE